ncbi:MAG: hypothetical protein ABIH37_01115 [archaeon]
MQILEKTKEAIKTKSEKMNDFLKMEYFEECSKKISEIEILRYCYFELSKLYEKHSMYTDAIKYIIMFRQLAIGNKERRKAYLIEAELLIKSGQYDRAEFLYNQLIKSLSGIEKFETTEKIINIYKHEIVKFEKSNRNIILLKLYEKFIHLLPENKKILIKKRILDVLKKLGKVKESLELEREINRESAIKII